MLTENQIAIKKHIEQIKKINADPKEQYRQVVFERNKLAQMQCYQEKLIALIKKMAKIILRRNITSDERIEQIKTILREANKLI